MSALVSFPHLQQSILKMSKTEGDKRPSVFFSTEFKLRGCKSRGLNMMFPIWSDKDQLFFFMCRPADSEEDEEHAVLL